MIFNELMNNIISTNEIYNLFSSLDRQEITEDHNKQESGRKFLLSVITKYASAAFLILRVSFQSKFGIIDIGILWF